MARQERTEVVYETLLCDGLRGSNMKGEIVDDGKDEPFRVKIVRVTKTIVTDGRGRNWGAGSDTREDVAELTLGEAASLARCLVDDLGFAARVAERRVLTPEPANAG